MKKYGILGFPVGHSLSPAVHNAAFKAAHVDAEFGFCEVPKNKLADFMKYVRKGSIAGLAVTAPYKETIMQFLDQIQEDALKIGAVNTVVNDGGVLRGYNTDFVGSNRALFEGTDYDVKDKIAVVIGGGGAARAVCYGLLQKGLSVWVVNRTRSKADRIAIEFAEIFEAEIHSDDWGSSGTGDILVNTVPIPLPDFCTQRYLGQFEMVMDVVYTPLITPLIKAAKKAGLRTITGDKMFLYQAFDQFRLWTGKAAPEKVMKEALGFDV